MNRGYKQLKERSGDQKQQEDRKRAQRQQEDRKSEVQRAIASKRLN